MKVVTDIVNDRSSHSVNDIGKKLPRDDSPLSTSAV